MKYYVYISDSKVDMLLPQVPGALKQTIAAKLGFDIKILSGESVLSAKPTRAELPVWQPWNATSPQPKNPAL
jgi:hypothetical protein